MKKYLLLTFTFAGLLFASVNAFAHCGACGAGDAKHEHAMKCAEGCEKPCCAKKADCTKKADCEMKAECSKDGKKACPAGMEKKCAEGCKKPCCSKSKDAAEPTASAAPSCCASKATAPA